jgi:hypothetical protein
MATNLIWHRYDWRESLTELPPFYLIPNEQDHFIPGSIVPADYHGLRKISYAQFTGTTGYRKQEIKAVRDLPLTQAKGLPQRISYEASRKAFRIFPRVPENIGAPNYFIEGTYKRRPTAVADHTMDTSTLPWDDSYLNVYLEALRWAFLTLVGDTRAGAAQVQGGQTLFSGQLATSMAAIETMAATEGLNDHDVQISPEEPLVGLSGPSGNWTPFFSRY